MEHNDVHRLLMQYNDDELFYKELFLSRNDPVKYAKLMENLNLDAATVGSLLFPNFRREDTVPPVSATNFSIQKYTKTCIFKSITDTRRHMNTTMNFLK